MRKQRTIRFLAAMLAVLMLSGCGGETAVTEPDTRPATEIAPETEPTFAQPQISDGIRYPVEWAKDAVIYEVNVRQYTKEGTFNAFSEHLQTLKDMGITTLWFMPIHPISETRRSGVLGSYYSITDYRAVNPEFGTAEDFKALVDKAHDMGFTVMMDWVANHTGWDCEWIESHPEWYTKDDSGNNMYSDDEILELNQMCIDMFALYFPKGDYFFHAQYVESAYRQMADIYASRGDADNALACLKSAAEFAIMFDKTTPEDEHISPAAKGIVLGDVWWHDGHNSSYNLLQKMLNKNNAQYDFIRDAHEFKNVLAMLRAIAK